MIDDTIQQIEARLRASPNLAPATREELLTLLARLRAEAATLPPCQPSESVEPRERTGDESVQDSVEQLKRSVEEFEESHPRVVQMVNHVANTLAGLGI